MNNIDKKRDILDKIFLKEEDTLKELEMLVEYSKEYFKIESDSCNIIFNSNNEYTIKERIAFLLISRYFCREYELVEDIGINIGEISKSLGIPSTTLSKPLGILLKDGIASKDDLGNYRIIHHRIKNLLTAKKRE